MRLEASLVGAYVSGMNNGRQRRAAAPLERVELGQYIVANSAICHGKPTFKGTRIMVWQVLEDVAEGRSWDFICNTRWGGRIPLAAVAEAVKLARQAWLDKHGQLQESRPSRMPALAAA